MTIMEPVVLQDNSQAETVAVLKEEIRQLKAQLDWFKQQLFGEKSEKRLLEPNPHQPSLFDEQQAPQPEDVPTEKITYTRRKGKVRNDDDVTDQGLRFGPDVPVERIELSPAGLNDSNRDAYEIIGEKITRRLAQQPASYVVLEYVRPVLKHKPSGEICSVPAPDAVFEGSMADVSVLAGLLVDKFVYHLPLYRQHQRLKDAGITVSRSTLTQWVQKTIGLVEPIADAQKKHILQSKVLAMDETPIKAGRKKKGKLQATWFWPIYGEADELAFTWSNSRGSQHIQEQLGDFQGILLTDGYAAYDRYARNKPGITQAQCWAHTRRYFVKAEAIEPDATARALELIGRLYQTEARIKEQELKAEAALACRQKESLPVAEQFFAWCHEQSQRTDLTPSNPLAKALTYVRHHQEQLKVFLGDPDIPIDTNHLERALRIIPMGRKNWLFCWSEVGAEQVGVIQSLLTTCRSHDVNPYAYLVDVLQRISLHPDQQIIELTPRVWKKKFADEPLLSDLARVRQ